MRNCGKGAALKLGMSYIERELPDVRAIVTMDADGQHLARDAARVLDVAWTRPGALVVGSRSVGGENVPARSRLGASFARKAFSCLAGVRLSDTQSGLRAFTRELLPFMTGVPGSRYEYETNVLLACARKGVPIVEAAISTVYHDAENSCSHYRRVLDTLRIAGVLALFASSSLLSFLIDYALYCLALAVLTGVPASYVVANVCARIVSATANYAMNRSIVFRASGSHLSAAVRYAALAIGIVIASSALIHVLVGALTWIRGLPKSLRTACSSL